MKHISDGIPKYTKNKLSKDEGNTSRIYNRVYKLALERNVEKLPLYTNFVLFSHFKQDTWYRHTNYSSQAIEIPLEGDLRMTQNEQTEIVSPGEAYLIHIGSDSLLECGPAGFCRKVSLGIDGELLRPMLIKMNLIGKTKIRIADPEANLERIRHLCSTAGKDDQETLQEMSVLTYQFLLNLADTNTAGYPDLLSRALDIFDKNLSHPLKIADAARELNISVMTLSRLFDRYFGKTPKQYFLDLKFSHTMHLLQTTNLSIHEIADSIGCNSSTQFIRTFRIRTGKTPLFFRKNAEQN